MPILQRPGPPKPYHGRDARFLVVSKYGAIPSSCSQILYRVSVQAEIFWLHICLPLSNVAVCFNPLVMLIPCLRPPVCRIIGDRGKHSRLRVLQLLEQAVARCDLCSWSAVPEESNDAAYRIVRSLHVQYQSTGKLLLVGCESLVI